MNKDEILVQVQDIFRDVLDDDELTLTLETTADDVDDWDSLSHIQIVVAIEKSFKIKFTSKEILSWKDINELIEAITEKVRLK